MQSRAARLGLLGAVIVAAIVLFVVLKDSDDKDDNGDSGSAVTTTTPAGTTTTAPGPEVLTVRNGEPVGGVKTLTFDKGDQVDIEVRLNEPEEEIHVHGYEIEEPAEQSPVRLSFPAKLDGIFEIEVHRHDGSEAEIGELQVNP